MIGLAGDPENAAGHGAASPAPTAVAALFGFSREAGAELTARSREPRKLVPVQDRESLFEVLRTRPQTVVCVGPELVGEEAALLLVDVVRRVPQHRGRAVVLAGGDALEIFEPFLAKDLLYFLSPRPPGPEEVAALLDQAVRAAGSPEPPAPDATEAVVREQLLDRVGRVASATSAAEAALLLAEAAAAVVPAERIATLLFDRDSDTLWEGRRNGGAGRRESAAAGILSFACRTGLVSQVDRLCADPRYEPQADNPGGSPDDRLLAVPVPDPSGRGAALGVLQLIRSGDDDPFDLGDRALLEELVHRTATVFDRFDEEKRVRKQANRDLGFHGAEDAEIFRDEALEHHVRRGEDPYGEPLEIAPGWTGAAFRFLVGVLLAGLAFVCLASIHEHAGGTAVVQLEGTTSVSSLRPGTVRAVTVRPGDRVERGDVVARFHDLAEVAELERLQRDFELRLLDRLRRPGDPGSEAALGALEAELRSAEMRLEERAVRVPHSGVVGDVWIRPGQHVEAGQQILTLVRDDSRRWVVAVLPGRFRPQLRAGMPLRFEPGGYPYAYQHLEVARVGHQVVGPSEARRYLGEEIGDALSIEGPVVFVYAALPRRTFESDGEEYAYYDGLLGKAEVRIRSRRILLTLLPGLEALWSDHDG